MIREQVTTKDYFRLAKEHKHFIWHFVQKEQSETTMELFSYFDEPKNGKTHVLKFLLDGLDIPYFESYAEESTDFLINMGIDGKKLYQPNFNKSIYYDRSQFYRPVIIGFDKFKVVKSSPPICYCIDGLLQIILDLNPEYLTKNTLN